MFAFAIYDVNKNSVFVARDRVGIKPLYYYFNGHTFLFSSEIRALLKSGLVKKKLNTTAVADYLRFQTVHTPDTIVENIKMLEPGHFIELSVSGESINFNKQCYWDLFSLRMNENMNAYEAKNGVYSLLRKSVEDRLISDVPFGAFLSGGIDSSSIVALMSEVASAPVKTFTVTFDEKQYSEAKYARQIASLYKTDHTDIRLKVTDFLHLLPEALLAMDHPSGDGANTYVVSKVTKQAGITMALSGLGGDELFAGYDLFTRVRSFSKLNFFSYQPHMVKKLEGKILQFIKPSVASEKLSQMLLAPNWTLPYTYPIFRQTLMDSEIAKIINTSLQQNVVEQICTNFYSQGAENYLSQISKAEIYTYMQNILLRDTDYMSMAHALEVRVPFLDFELIEFVLSIPDTFKQNSIPKKLLVDAMGNLLPKEIYNRKKMGFVFPWEHWLRNELNQYCIARIVNLSHRNFIKPEGLLDLWIRYQKGDKRINWSRIWYLVVLEDWLEKNEIDD
jgi:asparagine synthase (glutamine-hydrolysing)